MMYTHMAHWDIPVDDSFHAIMSPISQQYIKAFEMGNTIALGNIAISCARLKIDNEALWDAILNKLDGENLYRYLSLKNTLILLNAMVDHGQFMSHPLIGKLQNVIFQQKAYYTSFPHFRKAVKELIEKMG